MIRNLLTRLNARYILALLLLASAVLQPAHTVDHGLQSVLVHVGSPVLQIGDAAAYAEFAAHKGDHDNELCGQCQLGFMGDAVQTAVASGSEPGVVENARQLAVLLGARVPLHTRNRGPPLS